VSRYLDKQLERESRRGRTDRIAAILDAGASIDRLAADGFTPLSRASYAGHLETVELLLRRGADLSLGASDGANPLFWATVKGHEEVVRLLLANKADPNSARGGEGNSSSVLHAAISNYHVVIAKMLIDAGASIDHKYCHLDALEHAEKVGLDEVVALIKNPSRSRGAKT
jgi:ankyrin repeat protein